MKKITILVPAYNEALNIPKLVEQLDALIDSCIQSTYSGKSIDLAAYEWEYLFINDGSRDNTLDVILQLFDVNPRVSYVNLSRNFGKENAMLAGMDYAGGDAVIIMDADLQHPVSAIPEMLYWWEQGYEDVYGKRCQRGRESWLRKKLSMAFYRLLQGTTRIEILQNVGDFRLLDHRVIDAICSLRETQRYTKGLYCWVGYRKKEFLFEQADRVEGQSSFNIQGLLNLAIEGITCFTTAPLRISTIIGIIVSMLSLIYLLVIVAKTIFLGEAIQGFPTIICTVLLLGGLQLFAIGIIGEYIGRIFNESKKRPVYIAESYNKQKIDIHNSHKPTTRGHRNFD